MNLLEFAASVCVGDKSGKMISNFSNELNKIESKYFVHMSLKIKLSKEFDLPFLNQDRNNLLSLLFDLVRHGLAHQYQQIIVSLKNGKRFYVSLTGADTSRWIDKASQLDSSTHLSNKIDSDGDLRLTVRPEILFLDFEDAIVKSKLLGIISFPYLSRRRKAVDLETLQSSLP